MNPQLSNEQKFLRNVGQHEFDDWSKNLMDTPFAHDGWQKEQVGMENEGPYRAGYEALSIVDSGEKIVDLAWFGIVSRDYYLVNFLETEQHELVDYCLKNGLIFPSARVRESVADKLKVVDARLREHGLFLVVNSGWRHPEVQQIAKEWRIKEFGAEYTNKIFATKSPHATGGCIDVTLWSLQANRDLSFSWKGDVINSFALEQKEQLSEVEKVQLGVRRIVLHTMTSVGFVNHPGEYWHYGWGDPLSSFLTRQKTAIYGPIMPEKVYQLRD